MQDTFTSNESSTSYRRRPGMVGGVLAGVANALSINASLLRAGTAVAALALGPVVVLAYLAAWLALPVDTSVPASERPSSVPKAILGVVAAIVGFQIVFGLLTNLPLSWIFVAAVAIYWFVIRD